MSEIIKITERLRNKNIKKMDMKFYKGKDDLYMEAAMLEFSCTNNKKNLQNGIVSKNAIKMVKEIMKKLKVKSVNTPDGKPNINIDLEFINNKKKYCNKYFKKN